MKSLHPSTKHQYPAKPILSTGRLFLLLFPFLFFLPLTSFSTRILGTDFSYTCTSVKDVYLVTAKVYRNCEEDQLCVTCPSSLGSCNILLNVTGTGTHQGMSLGSSLLPVLSSQGAYDVVSLCDQVKSLCSNCGTRTGGSFSPGVEVYTFQGNLNLSSIVAAACIVKVNFSTCCRSIANITGGPTSLNYYSDFTLNRCLSPCNSSPETNKYPVFVMCAGQDQSINLGVDDPDGDSLSYNFAPSLVAENTNIPYMSPYSPTVPFPYLGAPLTPPNVIFPAGITLNPLTGDLFFRPIGIWVANLVIETKQWTKVGGYTTLAGSVRRDYQFQSLGCPVNSPVVLSKYDSNGNSLGNINYWNDTVHVRIGQPFCRIFVARDTSVNDTSDLFWNNPILMTGATITKLYNPALRNSNGPRQDSIRFCWTPPVNSYRNYPYIFTVRAKDRDCPIPFQTMRSVSIYVDPIPFKIVAATGKNPSCEAYNNGSISIQTSGGYGSIKYKLNTGAYQSLNTFSNLRSGTYKVYAKDSLGALDSAMVFLSDPSLPRVSLSVLSVTPIACKNDSTGLVSLGVINGKEPFQYREMGKSFQVGNIIGNLKAGTFLFEVRDSNDCRDTVEATLSESSSILSVNHTLKDAKCFGDSGQISLAVYGGKPPYWYSKNNGDSYDTLSAMNLQANIFYAIRIKDSNNCQHAFTAKVKSPGLLQLNTQVNHLKCKGDGMGKITLSGSGGIPPYLFAPNPGPFSVNHIFNYLSAGLYRYKILDSNNCQQSIEVAVLEPPTLLSISLQTLPASCLGAKNGVAMVHAVGGIKPYTFQWNTVPVQYLDTIYSLPAGMVSLYVRDSNNCQVYSSILVPYHAVYANESICLVNTDTGSLWHQVIWNKTPNQGISKYRIYGSPNGSSNFSLLDSVSFLSEPIYTDQNIARIDNRYYYRLHAVDSCGNESSGSASVPNVYLKGTKSVNGTYLFWELDLSALSIFSIGVMRSHEGMPFTRIATLLPTAIDYLDTLAQIGNNTYYLELLGSPNCLVAGMGNGSFASNRITPFILGQSDLGKETGYQIYPNPGSGIIHISGHKYSSPIEKVEIYNALGIKIYSGNYQQVSSVDLNLSEEAAGIYEVVISSAEKRQSSSLVLTR